MDLEKIYLIWNMVNTGMLSVVGIYSWFANRDKVRHKFASDMTASINSVSTRVTTLETSIKQVPSRNDLNVLHKRTTELMASQNSMQGELHQMNRTLGLIHDHLLNHRESR